MDSRYLESFIAVVDGGSISEAARRLNLTPAGVGQRLRALENELGVQLVARSGRTVIPTAAGSAIVDRTRAILRDLRDLGGIATDETIAGELRVGAVATAITGIMPDIMVSMRAAYPRVEIIIVPGYSLDLYTKIAAGELDTAIISEPSFAIPKTLEWTVLREEPLIVLVPASLASADTHAVLAGEPFIRYARALWGGQLAERYLRGVGITVRERFELGTLDAIAVLVDRGFGVSLVPDWAPPWPAGLELARLSLPGEPPVRRMGMVWPRASPRARLIRAFQQHAVLATSADRRTTGPRK